jgi:hypothetical protein
MVIMDSDANNQSNSLNLGQVGHLLKSSSRVERTMALLALSRNQFDAAEGHCHRSLTNARRLGVEAEDKTTKIVCALHTYIRLRQRQGDFSGPMTFAEEEYKVVVDAYDHVHPQVSSTTS